MRNQEDNLRSRAKSDRKSVSRSPGVDNPQESRRHYDSIELHDVSQNRPPNDMETIITSSTQDSNTNHPQQSTYHPQSQTQLPSQNPQSQEDSSNRMTNEDLPFIYKHTSLLLENNGSVARDHVRIIAAVCTQLHFSNQILTT